MSYLVFDAEWCRQYERLSDAPSQTIAAWEYTHKSKGFEGTTSESYIEKAGFFPEFGQIICICSCAVSASYDIEFDLTSLDLDNAVELGFTQTLINESWFFAEKTLLGKFANYLDTNLFCLVGQAIKFADIPYIRTRMLAHGIPIPHSLKMYGSKPWELNLIDIREVWKNSQYTTTNAANLAAICNCLDIESPKNVLGGEHVADCFFDLNNWQDRTNNVIQEDLDKSGRIRLITNYCTADVNATIKVLDKLLQLNAI